MGVTWSTHDVGSLDQYSIYLDGTLVYSGKDSGSNMSLKANGVFTIGQKLLSTNGTVDCDNSFSGKLSQINVWNYDVVSKDNVSMKLLSQNCCNNVGNVINWSTVLNKASEAVVIKQRSSCNPLRDSECCFKSFSKKY